MILGYVEVFLRGIEVSRALGRTVLKKHFWRVKSEWKYQRISSGGRGLRVATVVIVVLVKGRVGGRGRGS